MASKRMITSLNNAVVNLKREGERLERYMVEDRACSGYRSDPEALASLQRKIDDNRYTLRRTREMLEEAARGDSDRMIQIAPIWKAVLEYSGTPLRL